MSGSPAVNGIEQREVVVLGGGLAGLTLALQLRAAHPALGIRVLERRTHPVPESAFKVGESTVEIGAHYFAEVLGLREHLDAAQVRKFGFRFFFSEGRSDIDRCTEVGVAVQLPVPAWQIDRGRFENFLGERARAQGIEFEVISSNEVKDKYPFIELHDVMGALYDPYDGDIDPAQLTPAQAAVLAGKIQAPSRLDPRKDPAPVIERRDHVLRAMAGHGWLRQPELDIALAEPMTLAPPQPRLPFPV